MLCLMRLCVMFSWVDCTSSEMWCDQLMEDTNTMTVKLNMYFILNINAHKKNLNARSKVTQNLMQRPYVIIYIVHSSLKAALLIPNWDSKYVSRISYHAKCHMWWSWSLSIINGLWRRLLFFTSQFLIINIYILYKDKICGTQSHAKFHVYSY